MTNPPAIVIHDINPSVAIGPQTNNVIGIGTLVIQPPNDTNVVGFRVFIGSAPHNYPEVYDTHGVVTNWFLETTNTALPLYIGAVSYDAQGNQSDYANEYGFNGWIYYGYTNIIEVHNLSGRNVLMGTSISNQSTPMNFDTFWMTNPAAPTIYFAGIGLTITNHPSNQRMLNPMP